VRRDDDSRDARRSFCQQRNERSEGQRDAEQHRRDEAEGSGPHRVAAAWSLKRNEQQAQSGRAK
jgi:hypothetical protein